MSLIDDAYAEMQRPNGQGQPTQGPYMQGAAPQTPYVPGPYMQGPPGPYMQAPPPQGPYMQGPPMQAPSQQAPGPQYLRCRYCGSVPAVNAQFQSIRGLVLLFRTTTYWGPFCHDCGISMFRTASARMLVAGWWGIASVVMTPIFMLQNAANRSKVAKLPPPTWPAPGYAPKPVGRPLFRRWQAIGIVIPIVLAGLITFAVVTSKSDDSPPIAFPVGSCVEGHSDNKASFVDCGQVHDGVVSKIVSNEADCPANTMFSLKFPDEPTVIYRIAVA